MNTLANAPVIFEELATENNFAIGVARLNAEKSLNSLTLEMIDLLAARFAAWANDPRIAMVIMEGAGERAFCAGADLHRLHAACVEHHASPAHHDIGANTYALDFFSREYRLDYFIYHYPKPMLCWGHGVVMGGGMGLMNGASHRVVTEQVRIAMPEINIGLFPDVGGSWFLNRVPGKTGIFLALTAAQLNTSDALFAGFADFAIKHERKATLVARLIQTVWTQDAKHNAHALTRQLIELGENNLPPGPLRQHFDLINSLCRHAKAVDIVDAINALDAEDPWLTRAVQTLKAGSPTTAVLAIELQRRLKMNSLAEVFRAELVAALTCAAKPDLREGIRALLIDKDKSPHWNPATVAEVSAAWIDEFFTSPWNDETDPLMELGAV